MTWEECIEKGKTYKTIVITGCQRTGTTYTAKELARVLGYVHYDESSYGTHSFERLMNILNKDENKVIQSPALLHKMGELPEDVMIVMMIRDEDDVAKSMTRLGWFNSHAKKEYSLYKKDELKTPQQLYRTKIEFGRQLQLDELDYNELKKTENYVEDRSKFTNLKQVRNN
jgi:hypothetical protein